MRSRREETEGRTIRWTLLTGVGAVLLFAAVWFGLRLRDTTTPLTVAEAVEDFERAPAEEGPASPEPELESEPPELPSPTAEPEQPAPPAEAGVYVYSTTGGEELDALGGTRHEYPAETTLTVRAGGCGMFLRWQPLQERYEELELCLGDEGPAIRGYTTFHRFFGNDDRRDFSCEPAIVLAATTDAQSTSTCAAEGLTELVTTRGLGTATFTAGADEVEAVGVALVATVDGDSWGTTEAEMWISSRGLIVSWSETVETDAESFVGAVHYSEQFSVELTSVDPLR